MNLIATRRICQMFFLILMVWFCVVTVSGTRWWHLPGWPVNWLLELDPLVGLATLLSTGSLYKGLAWGVITLVLTLFLGRFFCGWLCPLGTLQQAVAWLGQRARKAAARIRANRYHRAQAVKYWLLVGLLAAAAGEAVTRLVNLPDRASPWGWLVVGGACLGLTLGVLRRRNVPVGWALGLAVLLPLIWVGGVRWLGPISIAGGLQTGLLDPLPLVQRAVNLLVLPMVEQFAGGGNTPPRLYAGISFLGLFFGFILLVGVWIPRAYCRFICPLGALFGTLGPLYLWRIGKKHTGCGACRQCETHCQGACAPAKEIRTTECLLCFNCWPACRKGRMGYAPVPSASGENPLPDLSRRSALLAAAAGVGAISLGRVQGTLAGNWAPHSIRPPGALAEKQFLQRCIKCGQCLRICPTNVLHLADLTHGWEAYWTPVLNFRIGRSGCQPNCVACSQICPTAALRPLSLAERMGTGEFSNRGPVAIGTAFMDRGRCLPWAMDRPCIVCQENCPVSPKAIFTRNVARPVRDLADLTVHRRQGNDLTLSDGALVPGALATGDYRCQLMGGFDRQAWRIQANTADTIRLVPDPDSTLPESGDRLQIVIQLQLPYVDPAKCIGCGICEHECPVRGRAAIRVSAEGETRDPAHRLLA